MTSVDGVAGMGRFKLKHAVLVSNGEKCGVDAVDTDVLDGFGAVVKDKAGDWRLGEGF